MKITPRQQAVRVLEFLMGLRDARVQRELLPHGLCSQQIDKAYQLLRAATEPQLLAFKPEKPRDELLRLRTFETRWLPIARAALGSHYPEIYRWWFEVKLAALARSPVFNAMQFLARYDELTSQTPFGKAGSNALRLLSSRGLNAQVISELRQLVQELQRFDTPPPAVPEPERASAEAALWRWFLEWSAIARSVIKDRRLLRQLGFLKPRPSPKPRALPRNDTSGAT